MSAFICGIVCPKSFFTVRVPTWSLALISHALFMTFCHPPAGTMATEAAFRSKIVFPLPEIEDVLELQGPRHQFHEAEPDHQVVLAAGMLTSGAASTSVANLKAAP